MVAENKGIRRWPERRVLVYLLPHVHLLDLAGPVQVFYEAAGFGAPYRLLHCGPAPSVPSAQGLMIGGLVEPPAASPRDLVLVPGVASARLDELAPGSVAWLAEAAAAGARVASICSGAFALGRAGLLDGRRCTTHWKVADRLAREHPAAEVLRHRLYVADGKIVSSAGVTAGIDMALALVEEDHGPSLVGRIAREIVLYLRRQGSDPQVSVYLKHRSHLHDGIHRVQDWLVAHPEARPTLEELAELARMSPRHLTREFRRATGTTLKSYANELKLEVAANLLRGDRRLTVEAVAERCGFEDSRHLRRLWRRAHGVPPARWRQRQAEPADSRSPRAAHV